MPFRQIYPWSIGIVVLIGSYLFYNFCGVCAGPTKGYSYAQRPSAGIAQPSLEARLQVTGDPDFEISYTGTFLFSPNSGRLLNGRDPGLATLGWDLGNYLNENPEQSISITGFSETGERNPSPFADIGFSRARAIRGYLLSHSDIPPRRIRVDVKIVDSLPREGALLSGPISLTLVPSDSLYSVRMDSIRKQYSETPFRLTYLYEDSPVDLDSLQRMEFTSLIRCLDHYPELGCQVVGFTNSDGDATFNFKFGKRRADFIKKYLMGLGISEERIEVMSRGERNPIAPNSTPEGQALNRRVEISLMPRKN